MDNTLMSLVLLICFIIIAFFYERFYNGRSNEDEAGRKKEENSGRPLLRYKHKKSTL
jgi:hypothetical protein